MHRNRHVDWYNKYKPQIWMCISTATWYSTKMLEAYALEKINKFVKWCWESWVFTSSTMELDQCVSLFTKPSFKWIKHLNVKPETMKVQGENIDSTLEDKGVEKEFWIGLVCTKLKPVIGKAARSVCSGRGNSFLVFKHLHLIQTMIDNCGHYF